ncbi:MAG: hypothetical protein SF339_22100 [Blastocatellia bacterium]|nr:hypothetical protein [Blastocatellia bacterium]
MRRAVLLMNAALALGLLSAIAARPARAQSLGEKRFDVKAESEALLDLTASVPGTSWMEAGREAATVTILVDGRVHQDLILFNGARRFSYRLLLGRVSPGAHTVRVDLNAARSAAGAGRVELHELAVSTVDRAQPEFLALAHAPILHARPNTIGKFSDVPLLMYYEVDRTGDRTRLRYSVIFSNEDGGTQTAALMARWGRTTDIEWVIETELDAEGRAVGSTFQGVNHETKVFRGRREADHPLLITASDNNNFADDRESEMRFAPRPIPFDLRSRSREEVMDQSPWTYRVMAEEMIREGKITTQRSLGREIADLRRYLYIDAASDQQGGVGVSFAVKLKGDSRWFTSDLGINYNKIDRSGYFRTTILLPAPIALQQIERIAVRCDLLNTPRSKEELTRAAAAKCDLKSVNKAFLLDQQFQPESPLRPTLSPTRLPPGEMLELALPAATRRPK